MTLQEIEEKVAHIDSIQTDDESAHSEEDRLHLAFIKHVAEVGTPELSAMAKEILKVESLDFARWCA